MTLGLVKLYTPSAGQIGNATAYNTDISALFNAFYNLESLNATLGGLTITPLGNSTATFNVTNASGTSIFSVDTTNGYPKFKTTTLVPQNIVNVRLSDNFSTTSSSPVTRTGASVTITTLKPTSKVLVMLHSTWSISATSSVFAMINMDSGTTKFLGNFTIPLGSISPVSGTVLFTGLAAASHTFEFQVYALSGNTISNNILSSGAYSCELIAMEI